MSDEKAITIDDLKEFTHELRIIARNLLSTENRAASIRPTALVNSALLRNKPKSVAWEDLRWANRHAFFASMHQAMRHALIDHARKRDAEKRPTLVAVEPEELDMANLPEICECHPERIVALEEALSWMENSKAQLVDIVYYHYFSGHTVNEMARLLDVSEKTIKRRLKEARLLLHRKILSLLNERI